MTYLMWKITFGDLTVALRHGYPVRETWCTIFSDQHPPSAYSVQITGGVIPLEEMVDKYEWNIRQLNLKG